MNKQILVTAVFFAVGSQIVNASLREKIAEHAHNASEVADKICRDTGSYLSPECQEVTRIAGEAVRIENQYRSERSERTEGGGQSAEKVCRESTEKRGW